MSDDTLSFFRRALRYRRAARDWAKEGFVRVEENGNPLWRFRRGAWTGRKIVEVRIAPGGQELWIKLDGEQA